MAKELIFMGRQSGKVRLALFDDSHGTARRLPVKEITEEVFVAGIKSGNLPVRGFGVNRGRITCKYSDWYKLPDVGENGAISLFGRVHLGEVDLDDDKIPNLPSDCYGAKQVKYYGLACVEWDTGMFRVMAPGTYHHISSYTDILLYIYDGPITRNTIQPQKGKAFGEGVDYTFEECDSTESIADIAAWMRVYSKSMYIYFQWLFQRCESFACKAYSIDLVKNYMTQPRVMGSPELVQLGHRPIDVFETPDNLLYLAVLNGRKVGTICLTGKHSMYLRGFDNVTIECENISSLTLSRGTHARLIRNDASPTMSIHGWEGFTGSDGDYTGYRISSLNYCFQEQPEVDSLLIDADVIRGSFLNMVNVTVEFTNTLINVTNSFCSFAGTLIVDGMKHIEYSFVDCLLMTPLDLRQTDVVGGSVNDFKGEILLPDFFVLVEGRIFENTSVSYIKICPDLKKPLRKNRDSITVDNEQLTLDVQCAEKETQLEFYYGGLQRLFYSAPQGSRCPSFRYTSVLPAQPVSGVSQLIGTIFSELNRDALDFNLFPEVEVIPENVAEKCQFTTLIFSSNIKKIETKAFVDCGRIRWVYIPETVTEIGSFISRPRIPYTICTQQGSEADRFARKNGIEVKYVDSKEQFTKVIQEVPEEMEGAVAVAILSGKGDGEEAAILLACETAEISSDIEKAYVFQEKTFRMVEDATWITKWFEDSYKYDTDCERPRLHITMAHLSNSAECNESVLDVTLEDVNRIQYRYNSKQYSMVGGVLRTTSNANDVLWVVLKGDIIINAFTENISDVASNCSIRAMLEQALDDEKEYLNPTNLGTVLAHLNYTGGRVSVRGKSISYPASDTVFKAIRTTYAPLGVYKTASGVRAFIAVDLTNLSLASFILSAGVVIDDGKRKSRMSDVWSALRRAMGASQPIESLDGWSRMYSLIGAGDSMLRSIVDKESIAKCDVYDYSIPTTEIDAMRTIVKALSSATSSFVTVSELKTALRNSKLARPLSAGTWNNINDNRRSSERETAHYCSDGTFYTIQGYSSYVTWFVFGDKGSEGVYTLALTGSLVEKLDSIIEVYDSLTFDVGPFAREEHYALVNSMLPSEEFLIVRIFSSGGNYTTYASFSLVLAVSRISGNVVLGASTQGTIIPVFMTNSFEKVFRILDLSGMSSFNHRNEWLHTRHESLVGGVFSDKTVFETGVPDFKGFAWRLRETRDALRRGECDGYTCVKGNQEIFDLAVKHPRTADYQDTQEV